MRSPVAGELAVHSRYREYPGLWLVRSAKENETLVVPYNDTAHQVAVDLWKNSANTLVNFGLPMYAVTEEEAAYIALTGNMPWSVKP